MEESISKLSDIESRSSTLEGNIAQLDLSFRLALLTLNSEAKGQEEVQSK